MNTFHVHANSCSAWLGRTQEADVIMLAQALLKKRPREEPLLTLELPIPPPEDTELNFSPVGAYTLSLMPGETVVLGRHSHGRLGDGDAK